jgi:Ca2+-binding EF-hand superfamily protein
LAASSPPLDLKSFLLIVDDEVDKMDIYRKAKAKFEELDKDRSGELDGKEITKLAKWILESEKFLAEDKDLETVKAKVLSRIDDNKDGRMGFKEFAILYEEVYRRICCIEFAANKFAELDTDGSGVLEAKELYLVVDWLLKLEERGSIPKEEKKKVKKSMMKRIDRDKDQRLSLKEFTRLCEEELRFLELKRRATTKFLSLDSSNNGFLTGHELIALVNYVSTICFDVADAKEQLMQRYDGTMVPPRLFSLPPLPPSLSFSPPPFLTCFLAPLLPSSIAHIHSLALIHTPSFPPTPPHPTPPHPTPPHPAPSLPPHPTHQPTRTEKST